LDDETAANLSGLKGDHSRLEGLQLFSITATSSKNSRGNRDTISCCHPIHFFGIMPESAALGNLEIWPQWMFFFEMMSPL